MIHDFLAIYLGPPPEGFAFLSYVVGSMILLVIIWSLLKFFAGLLNLFKINK